MPPRNKKAPKDKNAPKKPLSAYFIYSNERRPILREKHTDLKITDISKLIATEWKSMDDTTKESYKQKANELKKNYTTAFAEYKQTDNFKLHQKKLTEFKKESLNNSSLNINKKGKPKKPKKPDTYPKMALTAYFIYQNDRREQLKNSNNNNDKQLKTTEITQMVAKEWKNMSENDKKIYFERSKKDKEIFNKQMDIYKQTNDYKNYIILENEYKRKLKNWSNNVSDNNSDVENINNGNGNDGNIKIGKVKLPKKPKDKNAPKKIGTAYLLFSNEKRTEIINDSKSKGEKFNMKQVQKQIGEMWKKLSADDKKLYKSRVDKLKEEYLEKMKEYQLSDEYKEYEKELKNWENICQQKKNEHKLKIQKLTKNTKNNINKKKKMNIDSDDDDDDSSSDEDDDSSSEESSSDESSDESSD